VCGMSERIIMQCTAGHQDRQEGLQVTHLICHGHRCQAPELLGLCACWWWWWWCECRYMLMYIKYCWLELQLILQEQGSALPLALPRFSQTNCFLLCVSTDLQVGDPGRLNGGGQVVPDTTQTHARKGQQSPGGKGILVPGALYGQGSMFERLQCCHCTAAAGCVHVLWLTHTHGLTHPMLRYKPSAGALFGLQCRPTDRHPHCTASCSAACTSIVTVAGCTACSDKG
jgi:hypothetical protein